MYCVALARAVLVSPRGGGGGGSVGGGGGGIIVLTLLNAQHSLTVNVRVFAVSVVCFVSQVNNTVSTALFLEHEFFFLL